MKTVTRRIEGTWQWARRAVSCLAVVATLALAACSTVGDTRAADHAPSSLPLRGEVTIARHGRITIHTYIAPEDGFWDNTQIVETPQSLVIFDAQFFTEYAEEVAAYVAGLGKPVERIVVSHGHPDHWAGLAILHMRLPDAPIYAHPSVRAYLNANASAILTSRRTIFGDRLPMMAVLPTRDLSDGELVIDGVRFIVGSAPDAEAAYQSYVLMPAQHTLLAFDTVFPSGSHMFTVAPTFDSWIGLLNSYERLRQDGYRTILVGHGRPTPFTAIADNISYLGVARGIHNETLSPEQYAERLKAAFPENTNSGWVDFSSLLLYGVINP